MRLYCDNCKDSEMELISEDNRQEWHEETYQCPKCHSVKVHRIEFDQNGIIIEDELINEGDSIK